MLMNTLRLIGLFVNTFKVEIILTKEQPPEHECCGDLPEAEIVRRTEGAETTVNRSSAEGWERRIAHRSCCV